MKCIIVVSGQIDTDTLIKIVIWLVVLSDEHWCSSSRPQTWTVQSPKKHNLLLEMLKNIERVYESNPRTAHVLTTNLRYIWGSGRSKRT